MSLGEFFFVPSTTNANAPDMRHAHTQRHKARATRRGKSLNPLMQPRAAVTDIPRHRKKSGTSRRQSATSDRQSATLPTTKRHFLQGKVAHGITADGTRRGKMTGVLNDLTYYYGQNRQKRCNFAKSNVLRRAPAHIVTRH